jgi:hypothetical protein
MTDPQSRIQISPPEDPIVRGTEAHTWSDHRAQNPTPQHESVKVPAPFKEAKSVPASSFGKEK